MAGYKALLSSKALPIVIAAAFLVPGFVIGSQYAFYESAPVWSVGDSWSYKMTVTAVETAPSTVDGVSTPGSSEGPEVEEAIFTIRVKEETEEAGIPAYLMQVIADGRRADGGLISKANINPIIPKMNWENGEMMDGQFEEFPLFQWPLTPGATWEYTVDGIVVLGFSVANRDFITVADSTYNAIRIEMRVVEILEPQLRALLDSGDVQADFAFDYWYAPEVKNIARAEMRIDATHRDFGGFSANMVMELVRGVGVDLPADETEQVLAPETVAAIENVRIEAPEALNFAEGKAATFKAAIDGTVPENLAYTWRIDGQEYTGETVKATFSEPGLKTVSLEVSQAGNYLAEAAANYEVYYAETVTGTHSFQSMGGQAFEFPVNWGAIISWEYATDGDLPTSRPGNDVTLIDPNEDVVGEDASGETIPTVPGVYTFEVESDTLEYVSASYTLAYEVRYPADWEMPEMDIEVDPWSPVKPGRAPVKAADGLAPLLGSVLGKLRTLSG